MIAAEFSILSLIPLITVLVGVGAVTVGVFAVRRRVRRLSRDMFGTDSLIKGYKEQKKQVSESPVSVRSMTKIYLPQIQADFPDFDYQFYKTKAESVLRSYFTRQHQKRKRPYRGVRRPAQKHRDRNNRGSGNAEPYSGVCRKRDP